MSRSFPVPLPSLLELSSAQLEVALQTSNSQVERLAASVAAFVKLGAEMCAHADPEVAAQGAKVAVEAQRALFAMQFHDLFSQRIQHVRDALGDMHDALAAPVAPPEDVFLTVLRRRYSMEDERQLFDALVGTPVTGSTQESEPEAESLRGSVELF